MINTLTTPSIEDLKEILNIHRYQTQLLLSKGMFYTAKTELDICIGLSEKILDLHTHEG